MDTNNWENNLEQDRQCRYKGNIEALLCNCRYHGKAVSVAFSECVSVFFVIQLQCACPLLSSVAGLALSYFSKLSYNGTIFGKNKIIELKICVLIFCTTFVLNISHSKKN